MEILGTKFITGFKGASPENTVFEVFCLKCCTTVQVEFCVLFYSSSSTSPSPLHGVPPKFVFS